MTNKTSFLLYALLILSSNLLKAQVSTHWIKTFGSYSYERGTAICSDNNGNCYFAGNYQDSLSMCNNSLPVVAQSTQSTRHNYVISKLDSNGVCVWTKNARMISNTGSLVGEINKMVYLNGYIYCIGTTAGKMIFDNDTLVDGTCVFGGYSMIVLKLDLNGNYIWKKVIKTVCNYNWPMSIATSANRLYISGIYSDSLMLGNLKLKSSTNYQSSFLLKLDASGNGIWAVNTGSAIALNFNYDVVSDSKNSLYVGGIYSHSVLAFPTTTLNGISSFLNYSGYVAKYDTSGNFIWAKGGNNLFSRDLDFVQLAYNSSGLFFKAFTKDSCRVGATTYSMANGETREILAKFNTAGQLQWSFVFGRPDFYPNTGSIQADANGVIYAGALSNTAMVLSNTINANSGQDHLMVGFTNNGAVNWVKSFGGTGQEIHKGLNFNNNRIWIVGVNSSDYLVDGIQVKVKQGSGFGSDMMVGRFRIPSVPATNNAVITQNTFDNSIVLFPNPANDKIYINNLGTTLLEEISVFDSKGALVLLKKLNTNETQLQIATPGFYTVKIKTGGQIVIKKVIVTN